MVDVVRAMREAIGAKAMAAMDAQRTFSVNDAIGRAQALEPDDLMWLEDAAPPEHIDGQRHVTHSTGTPICPAETLPREHACREIVENRAARIIAPNIPKLGALIEAKMVADHADLRDFPIMSDNATTPIGFVAGAQPCATMSDFLVLEFHAHDVPWWGDMVEGGATIVDSSIQFDERPGLGLTLNEDVARALLISGSSFFGDPP